MDENVLRLAAIIASSALLIACLIALRLHAITRAFPGKHPIPNISLSGAARSAGLRTILGGGKRTSLDCPVLPPTASFEAGFLAQCRAFLYR